MTTAQTTILATDEGGETGQLGRDGQFVKAHHDAEINQTIDASLGLKPISIRLQASLIEDLKMIAKLNGIGYQPLMRQVLVRFADSEKKQLLREALNNAQHAA